MDITGYLASAFIGISLGLIGGGGSILTVPVLVYLFHIDAALATAYSLFIVGATSAVGSLSYLKKDLVDMRTALLFGIPSIVGVFVTRHFLVPAIPNEIFSIGDFTITKSILLLLLFAVLMIVASYSMIRKKDGPGNDALQGASFHYPIVLMQGLAIGALTGLVGAGGGFLIIPALANLLKLPMKVAVGTSLVIIAMNSLAGFLFSLSHSLIQWHFLLSIAFIAIIGILIGSFMSSKIDGKKLKPAFGWFVLVMGLYIIARETIIQ